MAEIYDIVNDLEIEIMLKICDLTPNGKTHPLFESPVELDTQDIKEMTGKPRLFQVKFDQLKRISVGAAVADWRLDGEITIGYPAQHAWTKSILSDQSQIYNALHESDSTVAGVAYREVPDEAEPLIETINDNDWRWMTIPVTARAQAQE